MPIFVALMLSTQLVPFSYWMQQHRVPSVVAIVVSLLSLIVVLGLMTTIIVGGLVSHIDEVGAKVSQGADKATTWVADHDGPLDLEKGQAKKDTDSIDKSLDKAGNFVLKGIAGGISLFAQLVAGIVLALAFLISMLADGREARKALGGVHLQQIARAGPLEGHGY